MVGSVIRGQVVQSCMKMQPEQVMVSKPVSISASAPASNSGLCEFMSRHPSAMDLHCRDRVNSPDLTLGMTDLAMRIDHTGIKNAEGCCIAESTFPHGDCLHTSTKPTT